MTLTRRAFLAWLSGACAALVAVPAEAKPGRSWALGGVYADAYAETY